MVNTDTGGMAGLPFANDMLTHLSSEWKATGGKKPIFSTKWKKKAVGVGQRAYDEVIIELDTEDPRIFSLISGVGSDGKFDYDWLHDVSITLDIYSSISEDRVLQLVNELVRILKNNVVTTINGHDYVQIIPGNIVSLNEEFRNIFRYNIEIDAMRFNP
tara:strand:+ start:77 stop:553 length:477 start_codon:yes stop_codon:yes gene_type:complete